MVILRKTHRMASRFAWPGRGGRCGLVTGGPWAGLCPRPDIGVQRCNLCSGVTAVGSWMEIIATPVASFGGPLLRSGETPFQR